MLGSCRLNNKSMRNVRRTDVYQAIVIDLALLSVITKEECEMLLDGGIPSGITCSPFLKPKSTRALLWCRIPGGNGLTK